MKPETCILLVLVAAAAVFIAIDRVGCWMERRGWISPRKKKPAGGGAMAGVLDGFQRLVEPQIEHRIQVMQERYESADQRLGRGDDADGDSKDVELR